MKNSPLHIGVAGELLVQYQFLKHGIDSTAMTTDSGIDFVAYLPRGKCLLTVQVKTKEKALPAGGGKGKLSLS